jgi:hypothetical protein
MIRRALVVAFVLSLAACAAPQQQIAKLPPAPPAGEPAGYAGIDAQQLKVAMGNPVFVRQEGKGIELWRYDGAGCKAFFFLYPDGGALSVRHVETLPRPSDAAADVTCLGRMRIDVPKPVS